MATRKTSKRAAQKPNKDTLGQIELAQLGAALIGAWIIPAVWIWAWLVTWLEHKGIGKGLDLPRAPYAPK